jgi:D-alanine-D-alanine ligase
MTKKLRVALLFGGRSAEHDVSLLSAATVYSALDPNRYDIVPIGVTKTGAWILCETRDGALPQSLPESGAVVACSFGRPGALFHADVSTGRMEPLSPIDVIFPVLHGPFGEDGSVQAIAELMDVAYVGSGVFGSAAAMDKDMAKRLLRESGLPVADYISVRSGVLIRWDNVKEKLGDLVFVKPSRMGSSIGVGKASDEQSFSAAVSEAFKHDSKILIEQFVRAREIECGVLQLASGELKVSVPGEIATSSSYDFYTYEAKYIDAAGATIQVPAVLPTHVEERLKALSVEAFHALGCEGLARVDFFLLQDDRILVNEINSLPGFTSISMYPKAFAASGMTLPALVDALIEHALGRKRDGCFIQP